MKKILPISLILVSIFLVSCGQKNLDTVVVTRDMPIKNRDQSRKVCEPVMKYITCSLEKAPEAGKGKIQNALKEMQRKIDNDEPSEMVKKCDNMMKILASKSDIAFKNGCFVESAYTETDVPEKITPPASATPEPVMPAVVVKE